MFRFTSLSMFSVLFGVVAISLAAPAPRVPEKPLTLEDKLKAKDFYETLPKFSDEELKQIEKLNIESKDPIVRLRSNKIVVDRAGNARDTNPDMTKAAFKYMESKLDSKSIKTLLVDWHFSHYTCSKKGDGSPWFLIEFVAGQGFSGGINLKYDAAKKQIVEIETWGNVPTDK